MNRQPVVLVLEDDISVRMTAAIYLREAGFAVIEAANATEALDVFKAGVAVDVVFADVRLPGVMDELMLTLWLYQNHPYVQVLVTSGRDDVAVSSGQVALDAFFPKPYRLEAIAARIRALVEPAVFRNETAWSAD
jgi:DNA-binding response OmpR family regulator